MIPGDGDVVEGLATVDESAITGESAPVIRESGGDRCAVTGGTTVLSDRIVVKITTKPGETFIDRMIALVEGAARQKTPNEIALNILLATLTIIFLLRRHGPAADGRLLRRAPAGRGPRRAAGLPHPDHHRCAALRDRDRRDGPPGAAQRAGHVRPGRRGRRRRVDPPARQDRHHHARQPPGRGAHPVGGADPAELARAAYLGSLADETPEGRSVVELAARGLAHEDDQDPTAADTGRCDVRRVHRPDPHVRRRPRRDAGAQGGRQPGGRVDPVAGRVGTGRPGGRGRRDRPFWRHPARRRPQSPTARPPGCSA